MLLNNTLIKKTAILNSILMCNVGLLMWNDVTDVPRYSNN